MSHFNYEICERFAPIFLRRTHVNIIANLIIKSESAQIQNVESIFAKMSEFFSRIKFSKVSLLENNKLNLLNIFKI
ncbi:hypothetical protein LEP1GSC186_4524 [Leptospira noguchii serovar Autumnalis str. ZUN142]|uniref:Uncharacterized protein n=1 Tax=Leptospira noguchii serovar Autumnalis str. ZUN142 TaxID=1085540 RepID=M6UCN3_9LEPT|nr:hypothetical protein LEP1GSC186_4524 [Leptospira noguchii serovar Autumnalis str. ZUN142]